MDTLHLGLGLVLVGLFFFATAYLVTRAVPALRPRENDLLAAQSLPGNLEDAVLVVRSGGRVSAMNERARQVFGLEAGELPDLEHLVRRIRPPDAFLSLCAAEGQAHFTLEDRFVEATSYQLAFAQETLMVVALRFPELAAELAGQETGASVQALRTFTELSAAMAASLDVEETIQAVMENVEKLIPTDFLEITIWNADTQQLTPYRYGWRSASQRGLIKVSAPCHHAEGTSGYLYRERSSLWMHDVDQHSDLRPEPERMPGVRSYLGVPLMVGREFVGTLELGARTPEAFREADLALLRLLSGQAAVAIHNALIYRQEKERSAELSGLSQLAQAFGSVRDPKNLFSRLVESIAPLLRVEILGFLLYNENQRMLEAQIPFHGLPDQIVELYRAPVPVNSAVEQMLLDQDVLISEDASSDPQWEALGLSFVAQAASLRETVLVPLNSGGQMLGYLQAANHPEGGSFSPSELHLLTIIANQAAAIIENATLVQQARQRAQRAEALRRISSLAGSAATLDEILRYSTQELTRLLRADVGAIYLLDSSSSQLQLHQASLFGASSLPDECRQLLVDQPEFPFTITGSQRPLKIDSLSDSDAVIPFYREAFRVWGAQSAIGVPLIVRSEGIGELLFASREVRFFDHADVQMIATAAGQLAGSVEQMALRSQTDESLQRRLEQLTAITRLNRELNGFSRLSDLIQRVYTEALHLTRADCGLLLVFQDGMGEDGLPSIREAHGLTCQPGLTWVERRVLARHSSILVRSINQEAVEPPHAGIQAFLSVPFFYRQRLIGLMSVHSRSENGLDEPALEAMQALAMQVGVAMGNLIQAEEQAQRNLLLKRELDTLAELLRVSRLLKPTLPLEESLITISEAIRQATPFQVVVISVVDSQDGYLRRVVGSGLSPEQWEELRGHRQPWSGLKNLLRPEFRNGSVYFIPADQTPVIPPEVHTLPVSPGGDSHSPDAWNADDFLLVPLYDSSNEPLGLISVDAPADGRRPDRPTFEALDVFGLQAGLMIENHRRTSFLEGQVAVLENAQQQLMHVAETARQNLPVLLRKDLEQTLALQDLSNRIERIRALLEIAAQAAAEEEAPAVLQTLCRGLLMRFTMQTALIAEASPAGVRLVDTIGAVPEGVNPEALMGQRNPFHWLLQEGQDARDVLLISSLEHDSDWHGTPLLAALGARSAIAIRLPGTENPTAVMVVGRRNLGVFSEEDHRVFRQVANQVGTSLQNLRLLAETKRRLDEVNLLLEFSRSLGSLEPESILTTLVENVRKVLPQAQAAWAGMIHEQPLTVIPQVSKGYADDEAHRMIRYSLVSATGILTDEPRLLLLRVLRSGEPLRVAEVDFATQYQLSSEDLMRYRQATRGKLPVSCMILPLRPADRISGVLVLENFETNGAFSLEDEALAYSFAQQAALALDNARLFQAAESRADQLLNLTRASAKLTASLRQEELIDSLLNYLATVIPYETATLWMRRGNVLSILAAQGFEDNDSRIGLTAAVEDSALFREMIQTGEPVTVRDVRADPRFPVLVEPNNLSWLGMPLIVKGEVIGLLALEKREAGFYTPEHIHAASTFAGQVAAALENARLFEESLRRASELDQRSRRLALLNRLSEELGASLEMETILQVTAEHMLGAMNASIVAGVMIGPGNKYILEMETPPQRAHLPMALLDVPLFDRLKDSRGIFSAIQVAGEPDLAPMVEAYFAPRGILSVLIVPLLAGGTLHGWFMVQKNVSYRFTVSEIELARTVCNQAAIAIQNARLFEETRTLSEFLERRVEERTSELRREHQNSQTLLRVISELSTSLDMGLVMSRALMVINESMGSQESLALLLESTQKPYRAGEALTSAGGVAENDLALEKRIMREVARSRQSLIIEDIAKESRWLEEDSRPPAYRSVLAAPLIMGEDALGALLLFHREAGFFQTSQLDLVEATARQIAITINNAELFNLIRDQSENLGNMLREQQIEASRSRAILEAVADGVIVTDANGQVTLFNASAERILDLPVNEVIGKRLDAFTGVWGRSSLSWVRTIQQWLKDPQSYKGDDFADEFDLDSGSVIAVHIAPVFWRSQFLGTVSILRDITHEVQVDRMKSEFVANVSHELRTPMTSIKGYVEIMLMGAAGELTAQQRHFLEIVRSNTERLGTLVNDLLDLSRIESGRVKLNYQWLDLREIAHEVVLDVQRRSREENKPMTITLQAVDDLPQVMGDLERIRQVIGNLVSNGYNYTPANGSVTVMLSHQDGEIQVDVKDTGIGIAPDEQPRMFERFYRGEHPLVLATAGTGLGLAVAKTLVEMHHGRIWFTSTGVPGEGSTFSFTLPLDQNPE